MSIWTSCDSCNIVGMITGSNLMKRDFLGKNKCYKEQKL